MKAEQIKRLPDLRQFKNHSEKKLFWYDNKSCSCAYIKSYFYYATLSGNMCIILLCSHGILINQLIQNITDNTKVLVEK